MRTLTEEKMENLLKEYEGVIYQALKNLSIYPYQQHYDDYYQLGCLMLFEAYADCQADPLCGTDTARYQFVRFAGQKLRWAFLDQLRKDKQLADRQEQNGEELLEGQKVLPEFQENLECMQSLRQLLIQLSPKEILFLKDRFYYGLTVTEIAKKRSVSRKTVYCWRKGVQEKAAFLKKEEFC